MKKLDFYKYRYYIVVGVGVLFFGFSGWLGWGYYNNFQNHQAEEDIYPYRSRLVAAEKKAGGEVYGAASSFFALKKAKSIKVFSKELEDYKNFLLSKNSYRVAHWIASVELAYFLIQYDEEKEALSLLENMSQQSSSKGWVYHALLYQLGVLFMNQKNYTRALHFFSKVASNDATSSFHQEVFLKMALCYEEMGEKEKARNIYLELAKEDSLYKERVVHYDRLLQVKEKVRDLL